MKKYIALLRGINVSGHKLIKMADLRELLEGPIMQNVQTYIQSGNIVFESASTKSADLEQLINARINGKYGFDVPVLVKTPVELEYVLDNNLFITKFQRDPKRVYVTFLNAMPDEALIEKLKEYDYKPEEYIIDGTNLYFYSPHDYGNAKMNNNFFEKKLKVTATTRNWATINKLIAMPEAI